MSFLQDAIDNVADLVMQEREKLGLVIDSTAVVLDDDVPMLPEPRVKVGEEISMQTDIMSIAKSCIERGLPLPSDIRWTLTSEQRNELATYQEAYRRSNPLGLMCADCFTYCILSEDGKRWLCPVCDVPIATNTTPEKGAGEA